MKRYISMLLFVMLVMIMLCTVASAQILDLSKYSDEELQTLKEEIDAEISNRYSLKAKENGIVLTDDDLKLVDYTLSNGMVIKVRNICKQYVELQKAYYIDHDYTKAYGIVLLNPDIEEKVEYVTDMTEEEEIMLNELNAQAHTYMMDLVGK